MREASPVPSSCLLRPRAVPVALSAPFLIVAFGALAMLLPAGALGVATASAAPQPSSVPLSEITNELPEVPGLELHLGSPWESSATVTGALVFPGQNPAGQQEEVAAITTPGNAQFGHFLQGDEFDQQFAPPAALQTALLSYLQGQGLVVYQASPFFWNVEGSAASMGRAFGTTFVAASAPGGQGYAPASPLLLPAAFAALGVEAYAGFQSVVPEYHTLSVIAPESVSAGQASAYLARSPASPRTTIALNITGSPFILYRHDAPADVKPATLVNQTYDLSIAGGTGPYTVNWNWGDGTDQNFRVGSGPATAFHQYPTPCTVPDMARNGTCNPNLVITVSVNDSFGDTGTYTMDVYPGGSPQSIYAFYDLTNLHNMGDSGAGTKIGLGELCDPTYTQAMYTSEVDQFSTTFGLPNPTIDFIGSGASSCSGGSDGWAGETMLDLEWSHSVAPNATIVIDLADSSPDEGDATWTNLANGVFIASNSWTGSYTASTWATAAAQGESFLASSGDCAAFSGTGPTPASDIHGAGVGGTMIFPYPSGTYRLETAWNGTTVAGCSNEEGSTGGYDTSQAPPWFQVGTPGFSNANRGVPDISAIGGSWVSLYTDRWHLSAGTSLASPSYAAMLDLMYQYNGTATTTNGLVDYDLYALAKGPSYDIGVHDVTVGNNIANGFGYYCTVGWDPVTGLGAPDAGELAQLLAQMNGNPNAVSPLTAALYVNISFGLPGLAVDLGVDAVGGPSNLSGYAYLWNFGDGSTLWTSIPHADRVYAAAGTFPVSVSVFANSTLGSFAGVTNTVDVRVVGAMGHGGSPLSATASALPATTDAGVAVSLSGGAAGGWPPYTVQWNFGDGTQGSGSPASHSYGSPGTYAPTVFVNDSVGGQAKSSTTVTVHADPTVAVVANQTTLPVGGFVSFNATPSGGTPAFHYSWRFDDGVVATGASVSVQYGSTGTFVAMVWANDSVGSTATSSVSITVTAPPVGLTAAATASTVYGEEPLSVSFTGTAAGGTPSYTYLWNFGDGTPTSSAQDPTHVFAASGTFQVMLTVTDQASTQATATLSVTVLPPPLAHLTGPRYLSVGESGTFVANATGGLPPYTSYAWAWDDGSSVQVSSTATEAHTFNAAGTYLVRTTVTDSAAATNTSAAWSVLVNATVAPPAVTLSAVSVSPTSASLLTGGSLGFTAAATCTATCPSGLAYAWAVTSSAGAVSPATGADTTFTAGSSAGTETLEVTATLNGASRSTNATITVSSSPTPSPGSSSPGFLGLPGDEGYAILAVVAVVVVGVLGLLLWKRRGGSAAQGRSASEGTAPHPTDATEPGTSEDAPSGRSPTDGAQDGGVG